MTLGLVAWFVPSCPGDAEASGRRELSAFKVPQVWLTLLAGAVGFGGMFAVYTYIAPVVTDVSGLGERSVPVYLLFFGLGMVAGTWVAGIMADWSIFRSLIIGGVGMAATMLVFWATAPYGWAALPVVFLITVLGSVLVVNLQLRLMDVAGDAQTLGAAMNHASLNVPTRSAPGWRRGDSRGLRAARPGPRGPRPVAGGRRHPAGLGAAPRARPNRHRFLSFPVVNTTEPLRSPGWNDPMTRGRRSARLALGSQHGRGRRWRRAMERRRELADRNVSNVVQLLERRQELRGVYPMADLLADNVGWIV